MVRHHETEAPGGFAETTIQWHVIANWRRFSIQMHNVTSVELTRDCQATQIPAGTPTTLPAGTPVDITQTLGGSYTVHAMGGGLFRIAAQDADALGLKPESPAPETPAESGPVDEKSIWETLRNCYDPEIPVNIVDL